jgi:glycosyltransferase involved in cell wall biosynthesis
VVRQGEFPELPGHVGVRKNSVSSRPASSPPATGLICVDTTLLRFAGDLRGIPQVVFILLEVLSEPEFRGRVRFLAYPDVAQKHLLPRGIPAEQIRIVPSVPVLGRKDRFQGLFSTWRYRRATRDAVLLLHPEPRSMTRLPVAQIVLWYDFLQIAPEWKPWKKPSRYFYTLYKYVQAMRKARGITISEHTKREALRHFPKVDPLRLTPLWLGARTSLAPSSPPQPRPFTLPLRCLYVGALEDRKNIFRLIENLDKVFGTLPFTLDLAGKYFDHEGARARAAIAASPLGKNVRLRGILPEEDLRRLMQECEVSLYPSLGEGFGLPVAEAMTHGHVVFAFRNTSIPEVAGDAAVLSADNDFAAWGRELARLALDPDACTDLRRRAMVRADIFSEASMRKRYREYFLQAAAEEDALAV